ncbi:peptidyl-prolyl cis-trans isomerase [Thermocrinis sp.]
MVVFLLVLLLLASSSASVVARIGSETIKRDEFYSSFQSYWREILHLPINRATTFDVQNFLVELVRARIIQQEARRMGVSLRSAEVEEYIERNIGTKNLSPVALEFIRTELLINKIVDSLVGNVEVNENQIIAYYYLNLRDFKMPAQVKLERFVAESLDGANEAHYRLSKGIEFLEDIKGLKRGEAIWYSIHALPELLRNQLSPYQPGALSKPIQTEAGYVMFRVVGRRNEGIIPLEEAKPMVRSKLIKEKKQEVLKEWLERTLKRYRVEFYFSQL